MKSLIKMNKFELIQKFEETQNELSCLHNDHLEDVTTKGTLVSLGITSQEETQNELHREYETIHEKMQWLSRELQHIEDLLEVLDTLGMDTFPNNII